MKITTREAVCKSSIHNTDAVMEKTAPMPWANRFGGPATKTWSRFNRGVMTSVAIRPSGLRSGPVSTRATKPYVNGTSTHGLPVITNRTLITTAPVATMRAEVSFTGLGNPNIFGTPPDYGVIPD